MSRDSHTLEEIRARLFDLSEAQFAELVAYVERAQASDAGRSFSAEALAAMRPRLRVARPQRRPNAERIFCRPFEDLLHDLPAAGKRPGRIARRAIRPAWAVLSRRLDGRLLAAVEREARRAGADAVDWATQSWSSLWNACGEAANALLAEADGDSAARADLRKKLGGADGLAELADMARMMTVAPHVEELRHVLSPAPLTALDEIQTAAVSAQFGALAAEKDTLWGPLAHAVIARMADPVALAHAFGGSDCRDPGLHFLGSAAAGIAVADIDATVAALGGLPAESAPAALDVATHGEAVADRIARLREGLRDRRFAGSFAEIDRVQRGLRTAVSQTVIAGADAAVAGALGEAAGAARAALRENAEARAHALWKCSRFAGAIGMDREVVQAARAVEDAAARIALDRLKALERAGADAAAGAIDAAADDLIHAVRVVELVAGSDKADLLRRRGFDVLDRLRAA
ncbi:MAG: hypothetical protein JNL66_20090 [Alphaproteobacteria bacterium]|nr:hypothetical protein [Alphaproteobacteria bacterium]